MATDLFTPILNDRTRSVRFFNGRLLSGEAMTDEQGGLRAARELLAQAVGDGVVQGLEVPEAAAAVQFRLLELPVDKTILTDPRLRNLVAYQCFGADHLLDFATDPFGTAGEPRTLLDQIRGTQQLTDCDVPLAVMYWTATGGIQFLDLWSVRRRVTRTKSASPFGLDDTRLATAEAMREQLS